MATGLLLILFKGEIVFFSLEGMWIWNIFIACILFALCVEVRSINESNEITLRLDATQTKAILQNSRDINLVAKRLVEHTRSHSETCDSVEIKESIISSDTSYILTKTAVAVREKK